MATRARGRLLEHGVTIEDGETVNDFGMSDEEKAFREFRGNLNLGDDDVAILRVSKVVTSKSGTPAAKRRSVYCFACPIDTYEYDELLEQIRSHYGGGTFRLIGVVRGRQGAAFNQIVEIAESASTPGNDDKPKDNGSVGGIIDSLGSLLVQNQERLEAMFTRMAPNVQAADPFGMFERMLSIMATMGMFPGAGGGKAQPSSAIDELTKLVQLRELVNQLSDHGGGGGGGPANFYDLAGKAIENFGPLAAVLAKLGAGASAPTVAGPRMLAPPPAPAASPAAAPASAAPAEPAPSAKTGSGMKSQIETLVRNARRGVDPEDMAETILALTPPADLGKLAEFVRDPACVAKMQALVPDVDEFRDWFARMRDALLAELNSEPQ